MIYGTKPSEAAEVGPPWIWLFPAHPTDARLDWDLAKSTPQTHCYVPRTILEFIRPGHYLPLLHSPILMFTCPLYALLAVDTGQHGQPDQSAGMQLHTQQTGMHCPFWHLSIETSINFFSSLSYRSFSVGLDYTGHVHQWALVTHEPVAVFSFLESLFGRSWPLQTWNIPQGLQF